MKCRGAPGYGGVRMAVRVERGWGGGHRIGNAMALRWTAGGVGVGGGGGARTRSPMVVYYR